MRIVHYMGTALCSICLLPISSEEEAFVDTCFHRFCHTCISRWSTSQLERGLALACPLCKAFYTSVIYDCHHRAYRRHSFVGASSGQLGDGSAVLLSAAQRRRRSLYFCDALPDTSGGGPATAGGEPSLAPALLERPAFAAWLEREVQALLLEEDVALVSQHLLGTVRALSPTSASRGPGSRKQTSRGTLARGAAPRLPLGKEEWTESVAAAARAYLFDSAPRFASELWGFAASGLSLEAHDRATFGLEEQPAMPPADAAAGAGDDREEGELSGEAAPADSNAISLSYSTDGEDALSGGSEAYAPLIRESIKSSATSSAQQHQQQQQQRRSAPPLAQGAAAPLPAAGQGPGSARGRGGARREPPAQGQHQARAESPGRRSHPVEEARCRLADRGMSRAGGATNGHAEEEPINPRDGRKRRRDSGVNREVDSRAVREPGKGRASASGLASLDASGEAPAAEAGEPGRGSSSRSRREANKAGAEARHAPADGARLEEGDADVTANGASTVSKVAASSGEGRRDSKRGKEAEGGREAPADGECEREKKKAHKKESRRDGKRKRRAGEQEAAAAAAPTDGGAAARPDQAAAPAQPGARPAQRQTLAEVEAARPDQAPAARRQTLEEVKAAALAWKRARDQQQQQQQEANKSKGLVGEQAAGEPEAGAAHGLGAAHGNGQAVGARAEPADARAPSGAGAAAGERNRVGRAQQHGSAGVEPVGKTLKSARGSVFARLGGGVLRRPDQTGAGAQGRAAAAAEVRRRHGL